MRRKYAFTLIELITVMAISAILLGIIMVPMVQTFSATRTAQAFSDAQDKARSLTDRISREIGEAMAVREVEGIHGRTTIILPVPNRGADEANNVVTQGNGWLQLGMNYTKLDLILPKKVGQRGVGGGFIDPVTGKEDPTLKGAKGQVQLPLAPGTTIKRYWIGLRDPFRNYNNPYDGLLMARSGGRDNLFVLYSAEVEPVISVEIPPGSGNFVSVPNGRFFDTDPNSGAVAQPLYDDPNFFLATNAENGAPVNNDAKADRIRNWLKVAQVETEVTRFDMIQPQINKQLGLPLLYNSGGPFLTPRITPLISFRPSHVDSDSSDGQISASIGNESESLAGSGSEVFQTNFGLWSNMVIRTYPRTWVAGNPYQVSRKEPHPGPGGPEEQLLYGFDPSSTVNPDTTIGEGIQLFNMTDYARALAEHTQDINQRYPFSYALDSANTVSGWLSLPSTSPIWNVFMPLAANQTTGKITASFNNWEVGNASLNPNNPTFLFSVNDVNNNNLPQAPAQGGVVDGWTNLDTALTPQIDPAVAGVFSDAPYWNTNFNRFNINRVFNKIWGDAQANRNGIPAQFGEIGGAHRFLDLRTVPQSDGTPSPLGLFPRAQIVPGTDEVYGPDQNPGANFGYEVRYKRVNREPGPNEYRINYTNITEPTAAGYNSLYGGVPPATYDRTNFLSAIVQPRFKVGYVQLCSNPEVPIPAVMRFPGTSTDVPGRIRVAYKFQFTTPDDVVRVEYDTRQLMQVIVTIRNYPQSNVPYPQTVTMKATANVRNFLR
ncbi:MAG TPA: prepilin-type N-terminal cleavage/methylation domain-containing protein [Fimbriimonas sp.]|nr:prepilin-type N-terminal cleavage/methylation domain-containing protein [Fimbriimonas sp.]